MAETTSPLPIEDQQKADFRMKLDMLVHETMILSGNYLKHPTAKAVLDHGSEALPWLLEYLREIKSDEDQDTPLNPWVAFEVICTLVPPDELPSIPEEVRGRIDPLVNIFDSWGVEKGYLPPKDQ